MNIVVTASTEEKLLEKIYAVLSSVKEKNENSTGDILEPVQTFQQILNSVHKTMDGGNIIYRVHVLFYAIPQHFNYHGITLEEEARKIS